MLYNESQGQVGDPSPKTLENIEKARTLQWWWGPYHIEFKYWIGWVNVPFHDDDGNRLVRRAWFWFFPHWQAFTMEFWNEGPVQWWRCYWLTFGVSATHRLPERRANWRETRGTQRGRRRWDATEGGAHFSETVQAWERMTNDGGA